jgi:hypothetical protein
MIRKFIVSLLACLLVCFIPTNTPPAFSWGFYAHQQVNRMAIFTLPDGMIGFYKQHLDYVSQHAVDADKRRYNMADEAPRHYIDLDHYGKYALDSIPHRWKNAVEKYSEDTLKAYGIVPWHIERMLLRLTEAFRTEKLDLILQYSADLGHYVADAHVPLHTTENYNGQLTNQRGIHGLWESRIPELNAATYNYWTGKAHYLEHLNAEIWKIIASSHSAVDSVLLFEKQLSDRYPSDKKYCFENRGNVTMKMYSREYTNEYNNLLNGMVEHRMRSAIITIGSLWYTAWINAGKPDLLRLKALPLSDSLKKANEAAEQLWKNIKPGDDDHIF